MTTCPACPEVITTTLHSMEDVYSSAGLPRNTSIEEVQTYYFRDNSQKKQETTLHTSGAPQFCWVCSEKSLAPTSPKINQN